MRLFGGVHHIRRHPDLPRKPIIPCVVEVLHGKGFIFYYVVILLER